MVVIGSVFVDIKGYPLNTYIEYGRNEGRIETVHGGVSRNTVEDLANLELNPSFVSLVDESALGQEVLTRLNHHCVDVSYVQAVKDGMGTWLAVFNDHGDVVASISKRPDLTPIGNMLASRGEEIFQNADSIIVELDMEPEIIQQILDLAQKYHKPVYSLISNMSIALHRRKFLRQLDCFVCNIQEAEMLFDAGLRSLTASEVASFLLGKVQEIGISNMVVTMGEQGAVYADLNGNYGICPAQQVQVVDTTGAGDSFFAGVAAGLNEGKSLKESCEIGTCLASAVISTTDNVCPHFDPAELALKSVH